MAELEAILRLIPETWRLWTYKNVITQTDAGGGALDARFAVPTGTRMLLLLAKMGNDDYAANRTANMRSIDEDADIIYLDDHTGQSIDNAILSAPSLSDALTADNNIPEIPRYILAGGDTYQFAVAALAQNETMTIMIRALILGRPPTIDISNSGGSQSQSVAYDRTR